MTEVLSQNPVTTVNDLKTAQQMQNNVVTFTNHMKNWMKILPVNPSKTYQAGSIIEFNMKGQGIDFINPNGSLLVLEVTSTAGGVVGNNQIRAPRLSFGSCGFISRFQLKCGSYIFQDIDHYNRYLYEHIVAGSKSGWKDYASRIDPTTLDSATQCLISGWKPGAGDYAPYTDTVSVPLSTCLDAGGYLPIYNIAEDLRMVITLERNQVVFCADPGTFITAGHWPYPVPATVGEEAEQANYTSPVYTITGAYFLVDGLTGTSGSILQDKEYTFHSTNVLGFVDNFDNRAGALNKISWDVKKTSLKKYLGAIVIDDADYLTPARRRMTSVSEMGYYYFSMGGVNFPYKTPIDTKILFWSQYQKYFHQYDIFGTMTPMNTTYEDYPKPVSETKVGLSLFAGNFDRLDQISSIISGIDTERYPIQLVTQSPTIIVDPVQLVSFFTYDIIVKFVGGEIKITD